jgi:hypothetical protein
MSSTDEWAPRARTLASSTAVGEVEFGTVIGVSFTWGAGETRLRRAAEMKRDVALQLWAQLGEVLAADARKPAKK